MALATLARPDSIPKTMKAAVLFGPGDMRVVDKPVPKPGAGEVLVHVGMCGMCGTDLKIYDGHFPLTPAFGEYTPGHEWTGRVVALGDAVDELTAGEDVAIEAHHGCGRCDNCIVGKYTACLNYANRAKGHRATGMTADGGFAQYAVHHVSSLYKLPPPLTYKDAILIMTAGTGLYGLDVAGAYVLGQDVAIWGPGPVGLMTVQAVRELGANSVILVGTRDSRLQMGRRLGADEIVNARTTDPVKRIMELTDGKGVDLAIEASGALEAPQQCASVTKRGGKIVIVAFYPGPVTLDLSAIVRGDITIFTSRGEGGNNVKRAVSLARRGRLKCAELITHEFPLDQIGEALRVMRERIDDPMKIVVVPSPG